MILEYGESLYEASLLLSKGINELQVEAKDAHGASLVIIFPIECLENPDLPFEELGLFVQSEEALENPVVGLYIYTILLENNVELSEQQETFESLVAISSTDVEVQMVMITLKKVIARQEPSGNELDSEVYTPSALQIGGGAVYESVLDSNQKYMVQVINEKLESLSSPSKETLNSSLELLDQIYQSKNARRDSSYEKTTTLIASKLAEAALENSGPLVLGSSLMTIQALKINPEGVLLNDISLNSIQSSTSSIVLSKSIANSVEPNDTLRISFFEFRHDESFGSL